MENSDRTTPPIRLDELIDAIKKVHDDPLEQLSDAVIAAEVDQAFARLASVITDFDPQLVIQFSPDHFQGFHLNLMPSFCVGLSARSAADWDISEGSLDVPTSSALDLVTHLRDNDFDTAFSHDMVVDHGFLQLWERTVGSFCRYPTIPVFLNSAVLPMMSYRRARALGAEVGRFAAGTGKRVLFVASGGLSHDPPIPSLATASVDVRARIMSRRSRSADEKQAYEAMLTAVAVMAGEGEGACRPLNPDWDRQVLAWLRAGDLARFDRFTDVGVIEAAGRAANETLSWVAAFSALAATGPYSLDYQFYRPIPQWVAGMGLVTASSDVTGTST